jgi:hypothetical protein
MVRDADTAIVQPALAICHWRTRPRKGNVLLPA